MLSVKYKPQASLGISAEQITQIAGNLLPSSGFSASYDAGKHQFPISANRGATTKQATSSSTIVTQRSAKSPFRTKTEI